MLRTVTVRELLVALIKKFLGILICAVLFAVLLGAFGAFRSYKANATTTIGNSEHLVSQYKIEQEQYKLAQALVDRDEVYRTQSIRLNLDQQKTAMSKICFMVVPTGLDVLEPSTSDRLASAYVSACLLTMQDPNIYPELRAIIGADLERQYISEMVSITSEGANMVQIAVWHSDLTVSKKLSEGVYAFMTKKLESMLGQQNIVSIINASEVIPYLDGYSIIWETNALARAKDAEAKEKVVEKTGKSLEDAGIDLNTLQFTGQVNNSVPFDAIIKKSVTYGIIGFILGGVLACAWYLFILFTNETLQGSGDIKKRYNLELLGEIPRNEKKKRCFLLNSLIRWLDGSNSMVEDKERCMNRVVASIQMALVKLPNDKKVLISGASDVEICNELAEKVSTILNRSANGCGSVLEDPVAMEALAQGCAIILVESCGISTLPQIDSEILRIERMDAPIVGIVIV